MPSSILSEANILAKLRHPGLPIVYDIEEDEAFYYIIEEYVEEVALEYVSFPGVYDTDWHTALRNRFIPAQPETISGITSGFKTVTHYSMWESGKINRFWNCIIYYQSWKKLSELWNKRFCGTGAVRGI